MVQKLPKSPHEAVIERLKTSEAGFERDAAGFESEGHIEAASEAMYDALKERELREEFVRDAQLADLARSRPSPIEMVVHREMGLVEVVQKKGSSWAVRQPGDEFIESHVKAEFRSLMDKTQALDTLRIVTQLCGSEAVPTDTLRRAYLKKIAIDFRDVELLISHFRHFAQLIFAGQRLWSLEKNPFNRIRSHLVRELAAALERPESELDAQLSRA